MGSNRRVPCMECKGIIAYPDLPDNKNKFNTNIKSLFLLPRRGIHFVWGRITWFLPVYLKLYQILYNCFHYVKKKHRKPLVPKCFYSKLRFFKILEISSYVLSTHNWSSLECSAREQVLHCKHRNLGCSSAEDRSSTANSGTIAAVLPGIE